MTIFYWIIFGLVAGAIANFISPSSQGGILGSIVLVSNIFVNVAPFSAQLVIISKTFEENEIKIKNLRKEEAVFVRRIIEGLRIFINKGIDTSNYSVKQLVDKLQELSTTKIVA